MVNFAGEKPVELNRNEFGEMMICSVRYAIGRRTYIVEDVCRMVINHIPEMYLNDLCIIYRDIKSEMTSLVDDGVDWPFWDGLMKSLEQRIKELGGELRD